VKIKSITLKNFQAHKEAVIVLSPGVTTIVGATDKGKSAILRAVRWVALNDIPGNEFIREGAKKTEVTLEIVAGKQSFTVVRTKAKEGPGNTYTIGEKEFKAVGQGVPSDISNLLQLNEINFQAQLDSPFWFCETGGGISRKLNSVIDLSVIDTALEKAGAGVRQATERRSICEARLRETAEQLEEAKTQQTRIEDFSRLKQLKQETERVNNTHQILVVLVSKISALDPAPLLARATDARRLLASVLSVRALQRDTDLLEFLCESTHKETLAAVPFGRHFKLIEQKHKEWTETLLTHDTLKTLVDDVKEMQDDRDTFEAKQDRAESKYHNLTKGKQCPLCQNLIR